MIYQISPVKMQTQPLTGFNIGLIQARRIQARIKETYHLPSMENLFAHRINVRLGQEATPLWFD
jgi:hypothetical protein